MLRRLVVAGLMALAIAVVVARPQAAARPPSEGYELWADCGELPDSFEWLPLYLGADAPTFVDLGRSESLNGIPFRALQYTRDKDFGPVRAVAGRWYGSRMGVGRWPVRTVDARSQLAAFRVTAWEVDGTTYPVDPTCVWSYDTDELSLATYNVWVRFSDPGTHTVRVFGRQIAPFYFIDPLSPTGGLDPLGLNGRRVFVQGERVGDVLDQQFVHSYELQVGKGDDGGDK